MAHNPSVQGRRVTSRLVPLLVIAVLAWVGAPSVGAPGDATALTTGNEQVWSESIGLIQRGRFEDATSRITKLSSSSPEVTQLAKWLDECSELTQMRAEMTLADYEKYVEWARKYHGKNKFSKALDYTVRALNNAVSKEAFRQEKWVNTLIDDAMTEAAELRLKEEWLDALSIYYQIGEIHEHDPNIRKLIRECRTHARLDAIYTEDSKWEERLIGIEPRMVEEAFREINQNYVEKADFREITETGLEQMLLLTESSSLRDLFESLHDDLERGAFEARIRANLAKVRNADKVDFKVARAQFRNALKINRQTIQLPEELVINEYLEGCFEELDEFTSMIWPKQMPEFNKHTRGDFVGVGIQIRKRYNNDPEIKDYEIAVVSPIEDSPAYRAGIQTGDIITKVNGESILGMSLNKAVETITGPIGTSVTLSVRRESEELSFTMKRSEIKINSIKGFARDKVDDQKWQFMIDPEFGIAYIRVVSFQENTVEDLIKTIDHLAQDNSLRALILDLRFNPGGLLRSAVQFAELFLGEGETIVSTRGTNSPKWEIAARYRGPYRDLPLVVMVNDSSASASEIVAGAIRDHKRGVIVGERTFGKFSVQNLIPLARTEAHLKLTTARYYLPNGDSLHRDEDSVEWGVKPDISVPLVSKEVIKIVQGFRKRDIIGPQSGAMADKVLSEEEADLKADAERTKKAAEQTKGPTESELVADAPVKEPAPDGDAEADSDGDAEEEEEEVDRNDRPDIDPQLDAALLVMRSHLLDLRYQLMVRRNELSKGVRSE